MKYNKPHLSYQQQLELLLSRNLKIINKEKAHNKLKFISYYRLSAYFIPFYETNNKFKKNTSFEDIINIYEFDREFRLLLFNAIERVEVFLRTQIAYHFSKDFGAFGYIEYDNFNCTIDDFNWLNKEITKEVTRSKENFVSQYRQKYKSNILPLWMVVELISFGTLSKLFSSLKRQQEIKIMDGLTIKPLVFRNWLHLLSYTRNISAHHSRIWNKKLVIKAKIPKNHTLVFEKVNNESVFTILSILQFILTKFDKDFQLLNKIILLLRKYPNINIKSMGFVDDWEELDLWKD